MSNHSHPDEGRNACMSLEGSIPQQPSRYEIEELLETTVHRQIPKQSMGSGAHSITCLSHPRMGPSCGDTLVKVLPQQEALASELQEAPGST